jgi:hypothetical protein
MPTERYRYRYLDPHSHVLYSFTVRLPQVMLRETKSGETNRDLGTRIVYIGSVLPRFRVRLP